MRKIGLLCFEQMIFQPNSGSSSKRSVAGSANKRRWILYGCRPKSWRKIRQVEVCERLSSCARREIDCLGVSCTLSRTAAMFSADLRSFDVKVLVVYRTSLLEFEHQTLESRLWRATASAVKWRNARNVCTNELILIITCYHLDVLLNRVTCHGDLASVTEEITTHLTEATKTTWPPQTVNIDPPYLKAPL